MPSANPSVATGLVATTGSTTYTITHSNFDEMQRSQTTTYSLPLNEGALGRTYVFGSEWDLAGRLKKVTSPAIGPLPAETITYGYDAKGYPYDVTGTYSVGASNYTTPYVNRIDYTAVGQVKAALLGVADTNPATAPLRNLDTTVSVNYGYAADTLWMNHTDVKVDGSTKYLVNQDVAYDRSGLPTQIVDLAAGTNGQTECYRYDSQQRLTAYYTQVGRAGTPLAVNNCVTTGLDSDAVTTADVTSAGGPDGYAALYTVDYLGQLTNLTERRPNAAGAVTTLTSILSRAGGTNVPPHGVTSVARKNNGTSVGNQTYGYDASGRQTTRTLPIKTHSLGDTTHGVTSTITYDGNGRWLSSSDTATGDTTPGTRRSGYVNDASGALLARHDDDAGDDLAAAGARPSGQRSLWLGTGGSAGIGATGMAGTGGLQVQVSRKPGATATIAGTASAVDPTQQLLTVSRSIVAPVLANGAPMQIATHTASALLSASLASGVVTQAATPATGRVWFTVGDAHSSLGGAGTPRITIAGNGPTTDSGSPYSQSVIVAGAAIGAWASGVTGASSSAPGTVGMRRTTPYGSDRTALATAAPVSSTVGATNAANSKTNTPGGIGALGFLNAGEATAGGEDAPVLPGAPSLSGSGFATTGLVQLGARGYDPSLGIFTAPDPVADLMSPSGADPFTYTHGRPGASTDPTGLRPIDCTGDCNANWIKASDSGRASKAREEARQRQDQVDDLARQAYEDPLTTQTYGDVPQGPSCGFVMAPWASGSCIGDAVSSIWNPAKGWLDEHTPSAVRGFHGAKVAAGVTNWVWGGLKVWAGFDTLAVGGLLSTTGVGTPAGVAIMIGGSVQVGTGLAKMVKGAREVMQFAIEPWDQSGAGGLGTEIQSFAYDVTPVIPAVAGVGDWIDRLGASW